jgi:hypothetical protein
MYGDLTRHRGTPPLRVLGLQTLQELRRAFGIRFDGTPRRTPTVPAGVGPRTPVRQNDPPATPLPTMRELRRMCSLRFDGTPRRTEPPHVPPTPLSPTPVPAGPGPCTPVKRTAPPATPPSPPAGGFKVKARRPVTNGSQAAAKRRKTYCEKSLLRECRLHPGDEGLLVATLAPSAGCNRPGPACLRMS